LRKHLTVACVEIVGDSSAEVNTITLKLTLVEFRLLCISLALFQTLQGIFLSIKTHHHVVEHQQFSITLGVVGIVRVVRTVAADDHRTTCDSSIA
jgi:hypothetical protein